MRITGIIVAAVFLLTGMAFAAPAKQAPAKAKEKSIFQIVGDTMPAKVKLSEKNQVKPLKKTDLFNDVSKGIKEGSAKAKGLSLRKK